MENNFKGYLFELSSPYWAFNHARLLCYHFLIRTLFNLIKLNFISILNGDSLIPNKPIYLIQPTNNWCNSQ